MGLPKMIARPILQEHRYKPLHGRGLFIGRQSTHFTADEAVRLIQDESVKLKQKYQTKSFDLSNMIDKATRYFKDKNNITDTALFDLFSDIKFSCLDVSDYEGAEIVHDMQQPVPENLVNSFDFIYNGSCMDNMSDAMTAMKNMTRMLKPGGRLVSIEMGTPHHNAYTIFSPAWFFDYCAINKFVDCKVYACMHDEKNVHSGPYHFFTWSKFDATLWQFPLQFFTPGKSCIIYVVAEKGVNTTWEASPIQGQYRADHTPYLEAWERFKNSERPLLQRDWDKSEYRMYANFRKTPQDAIQFVGSF